MFHLFVQEYKIIELNKPCFLRKGDKGSSWIEEGIVVSCEAIEVDRAIDVTGCGKYLCSCGFILANRG